MGYIATMSEAIRAYQSYYDYVASPEFKAELDNQAMFLKTVAANSCAAVADQVECDDYYWPLYQLMLECGAVRCPYRIYMLFQNLYVAERGTSAQVRLRLREQFDSDQWWLFTKSSPTLMEDLSRRYGVNILLGFDVQINPRNCLPLVAGPSSSKSGHLCTLSYRQRSPVNKYSNSVVNMAHISSADYQSDPAIPFYGDDVRRPMGRVI